MTKLIAEAWDAAKPGRPLVYIGEGSGGCCAEEDFFERFKQVEHISIPQYDGLHDYVAIGTVR